MKRELLANTRIHLTILIALSLFALLWKLGIASLADWDEAIYAEVAKEILQSGNWLTLQWEHQPWFEKPPLLMWVTALSYKFFGVTEFWARAASAFSGIGLIVITYFTGKHSFNKWVGFLGALILLTSAQFITSARNGTMDVMLTLTIYLVLFGYLKLRDGDDRWWYLICAGVALGLMTKGAAAWVAPVTIILSLMLERRLIATVRSKHFWLACGVGLLIVAPWHVLMYAKYGKQFFREYISYHVIARSTGALEGHDENPFYYLGKLLDGFSPWALILPFAIYSAIKKIRRGDEHSRLWLIVVLSVLVFYTLIPTKIGWYILPLYPAASILIATLLYSIYQKRSRRRLLVAAFTLLTILGGGYSALLIYLFQSSRAPEVRLAQLAASTASDDRDPLILFSETKPFYRQSVLFYSNRPLQQAFASHIPESHDAGRYVNYQSLPEVLGAGEQKQILMSKEDGKRLSTDYEINVQAEDGSLVYAFIRPKK